MTGRIYAKKGGFSPDAKTDSKCAIVLAHLHGLHRQYLMKVLKFGAMTYFCLAGFIFLQITQYVG